MNIENSNKKKNSVPMIDVNDPEPNLSVEELVTDYLNSFDAESLIEFYKTFEYQD